jgi:broad specificity phosphatase PhoE
LRKLILIKHASPQVDPNIAPERWELSEQGRSRCAALAEAIRPYSPAVIVSSSEPKAEQTAQLVAAELRVKFEEGADLYEHDRSNVPHMSGREFISMMELLFRRPGELVLGDETADEAADRFELAVEQVLSAHPDGNAAIVSHGTVIALLLARRGAGRGFQIWREMGLPSFAVLELPGYRLERMVPRIP